MFKNVLIFFSALFFFFSSSFELNSLTRDQVLKIKQKAIVVNSVVTKTRSKKFKLNIEKYKKSKIVFDAIKKKEWNKATKLAKNDKVLKKIVDWQFLYENNDRKFLLKTKNFINNNPNWPKKNFFRRKMELFIDSNLSNKKITRF